MPDLALLVEGGSFFSGKRRCAVSVDDADSVKAATAKIWAALGIAEQASSGNIEIFEASWDEYVVFEEKDQLANKAKLRLASTPVSTPSFGASEEKTEEEDDYTSQSSPQVGDTIGEKYKIVKQIQGGAMGLMYEAHEHLDESVVLRKVAIKIPRNPKGAARMKQELDVLGKLQGPNILTMYTFMEQRVEPTRFLVTEFIAGKNLLEMIQDNRKVLTEKNILSAMLGVLRALKVAHNAGFVHRDVKPANVMWAKPWDSERVTDFIKLVDLVELRNLFPLSATQITTNQHTASLLGLTRTWAPSQRMASWTHETTSGRQE
jgi:tRNA A-37 threonylcarbamoyl transferase component Bud32